MPSRIDVELTSARPDGTWTWRAAGAREPRGVVESSVLPDGAKVGDIFKVEATVALDGIEIHSVVAGRTHRKEPERIEVLGGPEFQAVTTSLVGKRARDDRDRGDRRDRRDSRSGDRRPSADRRTSGERRPSGDRPRPEGETSSRRPRREGEGGSSRPARERRERPSFAPVPEVPQRPKPKRLKPGRTHRQALMAALPEEQQPIADQLFRAGLPGVRQALQDQNATLAAEGRPTIKPAGIESLAQDLLPRVRVAEWLDRADVAKAVVDELDLRDLRSVVTTAADPVVARDDATRELAAELRDALDRRQNEEHEQWLADITAALDVGRVVRALRLSSRPPKAGVRFPPELASRLAEATAAALTPDAASERWAAVVEALAFSPVHSVVAPAAPPDPISDELRAMVKGVAGAVPQIATLLAIEVPPPGSRPARAPRLPRRPSKPKPPSEPRSGRPPAERGPTPSTRAAKDEPPPAEPAADAEKAPDEVPAETDAAPAVVEPVAPAGPAVEPTADAAPAVEPADDVPAETDAAPAVVEPVAAAGPAVEPTADAAPAVEPTADAAPAVEPTADAAPAVEPAAVEPAAPAVAEGEPEPPSVEPAAEPEAAVDAAPAAEREAEPAVDPRAEPQPEPAAVEPAAEPEPPAPEAAVAEPGADVEPEPEPGPAPEAQSDSEPSVDTEPAPAPSREEPPADEG